MSSTPYVVSLGGAYCMAVDATSTEEGIRDAVAALSPHYRGRAAGEFRLHLAGEWDRLCRDNRTDSADSDMQAVARSGRKRAALANGVRFTLAT